MNGYRWTVRVGLGGVGFLATLAAFVAVTRIFKPGRCRRAARGVGAGRHADRAVHYRCGVAGDCWDGLGRDRCTVEAKGGWCLSSSRAFSVRSSLP